MNTAKLSFSAAASGPDLRLVVTLNDSIIYDAYPESDPTQIEFEFDDTQERDHVLSFEMRGKLPEHTKVSPTGEILQDRCITIADVAFDDIALGYMFAEVSRYYHNNNDTTEPCIESFYGIMGCNGRVELSFSTPIYLWLLENM